MYKLLSGAKSVKQYRGDENLPEAKKGMKNCGCKHPKAKYKYGSKGLIDPPPSKVYNTWYEDPEGGQFQIDPNKYERNTPELVNNPPPIIIRLFCLLNPNELVASPDNEFIIDAIIL
mgnify:CR=1 FL=1